MYSHSISFSRNMKNNVYSCKPKFYYIKVGFKGVKSYTSMFSRCVPLAEMVESPQNVIGPFKRGLWLCAINEFIFQPRRPKYDGKWYPDENYTHYHFSNITHKKQCTRYHFSYITYENWYRVLRIAIIGYRYLRKLIPIGKRRRKWKTSFVFYS